jgi:hypothetical protein
MNNNPGENRTNSNSFGDADNGNTGATRKFDTSDIKSAGESLVSEPMKTGLPKSFGYKGKRKVNVRNRRMQRASK